MNEMLESVKSAIGITGTYQDESVTVWMNDVIDYIKKAGVQEEDIPFGLVARGVADIWNLGSGDGKLSPYFYERVAQLS